METAQRILIIDDDPAALSALGEAMTREGLDVTLAASGEEGLAVAGNGDFEIVLTDLRMKGADGLQVLKSVKAKRPKTVIMVMTAFASMDTVVEAISAGAYDYISKPFRLDEMRHKIRQALAHVALLRENENLREKAGGYGVRGDLVGSSPAMVEVFKTIAKVAASDATVLVVGDSGTGKELVARSVHRLGKRRERPFQAVNCAALTESLLESELFGYIKGAFTGATTSRRGIFEVADRGTVFLDEIGDTSPAMQSKLLRVLESGEILPVGSSSPTRVDVRVVAATHRDLKEMVSQGNFREDLYYRLQVVNIQLPSLKERASDIPILFDHFLKLYSARQGKTLAVSPGVLDYLQGYSWPGNVRELENAVESAVALNRSGVFSVEDLPAEVRNARPSKPRFAQGGWPTLAQVEERYIREVLEGVNGNMSRAAEILGIDRRTLYRKLERESSTAED